ALERKGMRHDASAGIATALAASGANLKKLSPRHTLEVTWTLDGRQLTLRYEPSPWLGYAVVPSDGGWEVSRAQTRPDVRVDVVAGEVTRSPFEGGGGGGGGARPAGGLAAVFAVDVDLPPGTRPRGRPPPSSGRRVSGELLA